MRLALAVSVLLASAIATQSTLARPIVNKAVLKSFYETGDVPTESQFGNFIDSMVNLTGNLNVVGIAVTEPASPPAPGGNASSKRFGVGIEVPEYPLDYLSPNTYSILVEPEFAGQSGYMALLLNDALGETYYGFL
jgi:hypothetical protein